MVLNPAVIALLLSSCLISGMILYSSFFGLQIIRKWDITSGSEAQLNMERRTYLISTILSYVFGFQLISLFLFVYTADNLHSLFVGAMCAAGTLNVNKFGYPALLLKVTSFLLSGLWLIINHTDNKAYDYPLIMKKYLLLILISPLFIFETIILARYLLSLRADVITSCCGALFSTQRDGLIPQMVSLPILSAKLAFFSLISVTIISGLYFLKSGKGAYIFSFLNVVTFIVSVIAIISFISIYFYELPTHHCLFCILQREYKYIGYPLYISLFVSTVSGIGTGVLNTFKKIKSLRDVVPKIQRKLVIVSLISDIVFLTITIYPLVFSDFTLD